METKQNICPRCKRNKLNEVEVRNALSRRDNKTYICSECGTAEAIFDFVSRGKATEDQLNREKDWLVN